MIENVQCLPPGRLHKKKKTHTGRMATRQHLTSQAIQAGMCFVLNEYSDAPDTSAYMVGQNVPLPTDATYIKNIATFNVRAMDDNDEPWATDAGHRTGWNKTFKSETYRGILYGIVLRDYQKQVVSLAKAKSVMCEFLSCTQRHDRIDATTSIAERKTGGPASAGACPGGCKECSHKGSNAHFIRLTCKIRGTVRKEECHPPQDQATCSHRHLDHR